MVGGGLCGSKLQYAYIHIFRHLTSSVSSLPFIPHPPHALSLLVAINDILHYFLLALFIALDFFLPLALTALFSACASAWKAADTRS